MKVAKSIISVLAIIHLAPMPWQDSVLKPPELARCPQTELAGGVNLSVPSGAAMLLIWPKRLRMLRYWSS
ncbi:MAG: hypothetical protein ACI87O_002749 [Planctomycetota bacterium]|jgi:hypothetical protein